MGVQSPEWIIHRPLSPQCAGGEQQRTSALHRTLADVKLQSSHAELNSGHPMPRTEHTGISHSGPHLFLLCPKVVCGKGCQRCIECRLGVAIRRKVQHIRLADVQLAAAAVGGRRDVSPRQLRSGIGNNGFECAKITPTNGRWHLSTRTAHCNMFVYFPRCESMLAHPADIRCTSSASPARVHAGVPFQPAASAALLQGICNVVRVAAAQIQQLKLFSVEAVQRVSQAPVQH